ncbi:glycosyltransferase family protein [Thermoanaerobacterium sp. CMT5567-10]|uniref:glycosyltransferase family protein n=1 Tax=Thermoanaerobacterium sp. CMT5567-10 TaxID=3061989 RepID=UPI0026E104FB|nr:glycosyltransferase family protein [Thermoanaerobacterium sp. CMT5567-10]WKV09845.1 glycosyltransferase family protein [Thermoanaerobacterium sp. CMT5567-10]
MKKVAIIQARMGSTRLPGKVMKIIMDKPVIEHVVNRVKASKEIDDIIIATTTKKEDDIIVEEAQKLNVKYYRGSENDVLSRYYYAAKENNADIVIRITSDCPVIDPKIIDDMIYKFMQLYEQDNIDYMSNTIKRTYPRGLDVEIFTFESLEKAFIEADKSYQREHVTPYIYENPEIFKIGGFKNNIDYSSYRWTLDTIEDFKVIESIYQALYDKDRLFYFTDIISFIKEHPEISEINKNIEQKKLI